MDQSDKDWKLELRYGRRKTPYHHFSVIAEGVVGQLVDGFSCRPGSAFMGMKAWASSTDEAVDMVYAISENIGFSVTGKVQVYETEPSQPPRERPHGYDIQFTPFDASAT